MLAEFDISTSRLGVSMNWPVAAGAALALMSRHSPLKLLIEKREHIAGCFDTDRGGSMRSRKPRCVGRGFFIWGSIVGDDRYLFQHL